ncbi:MAG: LytTR family transcriptional regulator DNA-binding domain-containing protein [Candidatus Riflebacteria bacterium]|nr:LytTR family transcriptional regulator DNA-binding domain-containing protein [Candidatus Riflebacteria bacterium]
MTQEIEKRVKKLYLAEKSIVSANNEIYRAKNVVYFYSEAGKAYAITENDLKFEIVQSFNSIETEFEGYFLRVHRSFLVAVNRITGIFERYPESEDENPSLKDSGGVLDECELELSGSKNRVPVTTTYAKGLKKHFGMTSLHHLVPEYPDDKRLRLYGLINFGWRELYNLDPKNLTAVEVFKKKWDVKQFNKNRMLSYFRQFGVNEIDKRRVIKNIIYQMFEWIKKGIEKPSDGNIRSLWYRIKAVLAYHSNILEPGDVDIFYNTLQEMIESEGFFRYKDFGFMDMNEPYRGIGGKFPEIILASEKLGHYIFIKKMAMEKGVSFICLKGEPAVISLEYFSDDLLKACGDKEKTIFCISDIDPAGYSIENNLVSGLQKHGHKVKSVLKLVDTSVFTSEEIAFVKYPVVSFDVKGSETKPIEPATMGQVTKGRDWFNLIKDDRLISEKEKGDGWKTTTIWGIESDAADREIIKQRFLSGFETPKKQKKLSR